MIAASDAATRIRVSRRRRVRGALLAALVVLTSASCSSDDDAPVSRAEVSALLAHHGAAVRDHDERVFLAGTDGAYRTRQRQVFANLEKLAFSSWTYTIGPTVQDSSAQRAARTKYGASALVVRVSLSYALRGMDAHPASHELFWTFARRGDAAAIVADDGVTDTGGASWHGPWDFGPIRVSRGRSSLIIASASDAALTPTLVADVDRAVPVVRGVVGSGAPTTVAVLVPGSDAAREAALGSADGAGESDEARIGAVATSAGDDPSSGDVLEQRVVVVADEFGTLTQNGGRVVLQHELTHLATVKQTTSASPTWLVEGFADYVGYLGNERPVRAAAAELITQIAKDGPPTALPDSAAFASASTSVAAYELSWLACRRIAETYGQGALVRFYDAVGTATVPSDQAVADAARGVLGETTAQLTARTRSYVAEQLT